jgi:arabinofuranan 3-O-arabinosyltransferase
LFRVLQGIGLPTWVAQRLWLGTLVFAAGTGVRWCARTLGASPAGALAAGMVYALSPYLLGYEHRTSVLLLPWAGLGWWVGLAVLSGRTPGWRYPALFALVAFTVGGQNATAVLLCGLGPALWLLHAALSRTVAPRVAAAAAGRIAVLTAAVSAWWFVPILVQAHYGADVLAYSETVQAVSVTSLASEVIRGLGYWLFYGGDITGRWAASSTPYLQNPGLIALGFAMPAIGVAAVAVLRWPHRTYLALLVVVGVVVAVGAHPFGEPSPLGAFIKGSSARSALILALRSSTRAIPLVLLAFSLAVAMVLTALADRVPRVAVPLAGLVCALAVLQLPSLWNGTLVDRVLRRPEALPSWWTDAAAALGAQGDSTRIFELPGAEFAAYRWGVTTDAILPGLTSRPVVTRDLLPLGTVPAMDLLFALDDRFQTGTVDPAAIAPVARLFGAGDVVLRGDAAFERYQTPRPEETWALYSGGVPGLGRPVTYGPFQPNVPAVPMIDETALSDPAIGTPVPPVAVLPVQQPDPIMRARDASRRVVVDGSGDGVVDAAVAGLLDGSSTVLYAASTPDVASLRAVASSAELIVTDSNRDRARQWRGSQDTVGYTEDGGLATLVNDPADQRLNVFPGAPDSARTLAEQRGAARVVASGYGTPDAYWPEDRPAMALDGDVSTAWRVGAGGPVIGERLRVELRSPQTVDHVTLVQPAGNRTITRVRVSTDVGRVDADLTHASLTPAGQTIALPAGPTDHVEIEILASNPGTLPSYFGLDPVGFSEVRIDGVRVDEVVRVPHDLLDALGPTSTNQPLAVVLTRQRVDPRRRWRDDDERALVRAVTLPSSRTFRLDGQVRLSGRAGSSRWHGPPASSR